MEQPGTCYLTTRARQDLCWWDLSSSQSVDNLQLLTLGGGERLDKGPGRTGMENIHFLSFNLLLILQKSKISLLDQANQV